MTHRHLPFLAAGAVSLVGLLWVLSVLPAQVRAQEPDGSPAHAQAQSSVVPAIQPDAKKARGAYQQGIRAERKQDWEAAFAAYDEALNWAPAEREYLLRREVARSRLVQQKMDAAERDAVSGHVEEARKQLQVASYLDPSNAVVRERLAELAALEPGVIPQAREPAPAGPVHLAYQSGTRSFNYRGDTQGAYQEVARQFGVEAAFDLDLVGRPVRFRMDDVDFQTALRLLGNMTRTFWRPLTPHLFFVAADTPQKRRDYEPSLVHTVLLPASETPDQMTETLRVVRDITGITRADLDTRTGTITLRASPRALAVAADLIDELEKPVGELILEMEVLEVDRNYARQLGLTPPENSQIITLNPQQLQDIQQNGLQGLVDVINQVIGLPSSLSGLSSSQIATLIGANQLNLSTLLPPIVAFGGGRTTFLATVPGAAANFSEMLSLVRHGRRILLRAQDGRPATFFVGDRIPVSLATLSSSFAGAGAGTPGLTSTNFPTTNYAVGNTPSFVATAILRTKSAFNDLVVANSTDNTISVLLGNGDGTFETQVTYPLGATTDTDPVWIATGDFNNDGNVDLAVANKGSNTISIFLGNGDGTFKAATDIATGHSPVAVSAANLNTNSSSNNNVDLAVVNQADNTVSIFLGDGTGKFTPLTTTIATGRTPTSIAAADFNDDTKIDLAVTNSADNTVSVFLGNGDGTFTQAPNSPFAVGNSPAYVAVGDFNADGFPSLATANNGAPTSTNTGNTVSILLNQLNGAGKPTANFLPPSAQRDFPAGNGPISIAVADYNIDGLPDLAVAAQSDNAVSVLLNLGGGLFGPFFELPVGTSPASITTAVFNGNSRPDVATANSGSANVSVILNSTSFTGQGNALAGTLYPGAEYLDIGLKVKATPRIHPNHEVTLQLSFDISSLTTQSFNAIPVIQREAADQTVRVKENETAALAGFLVSQLSSAIAGTPGIAGQPGIGWLAQNQTAQDQSSELLILVTPRSVRSAPRHDHSIYAGQGALEGGGAAAGPAAQPPVAPAPVPPSPAGEPTPPGAAPPSTAPAPPSPTPAPPATPPTQQSNPPPAP